MVAVLLAGAWLFTASSRVAYSCSTISQPAAPVPSGGLGAIQPEQGNRHVSPNSAITYTACPPASGNHIFEAGLGPIQAGFYGPDDPAIPNGWVHNLEHGGLVVLYSCNQGACDTEDLDALRALFRGWEDTLSPVCQLPATRLGVVARFEQMAKPYVALMWGRILYMDALDPAQVDQFFARENELLSEDGTEMIVPPEQQCALPSPEPSPSPSVSPSGSVSPSPSGSASPSTSPSASASASGSASPSAS